MNFHSTSPPCSHEPAPLNLQSTNQPYSSASGSENLGVLFATHARVRPFLYQLVSFGRVIKRQVKFLERLAGCLEVEGVDDRDEDRIEAYPDEEEFPGQVGCADGC